MREHFESYAARIVEGIRYVGADIDPEVLQLPGGSVIATLLWLYAKGADAIARNQAPTQHH